MSARPSPSTAIPEDVMAAAHAIRKRVAGWSGGEADRIIARAIMAAKAEGEATEALEERVLRQLDSMKGNIAYDQRMVSIAFTGIQEAFMWANRAVFQPTRVALPEDADKAA